MTKTLLEPLSYTVVVINSVDIVHAIFFPRLYEDFHPILTDYIMPGMNGIELTRKIRGIRHDIPVIYVLLIAVGSPRKWSETPASQKL